MIEITIIKLLLLNNIYLKYGSLVSKYLDSKELKNVFLTISYLHDSFSKDISVEELELAFKSGSNLDEKKYSPYELIFNKMREVEVSPEVAESALEAFRERAWLSSLTLASMDALDGRKSTSEVIKLLEEKNAEILPETDEIEFVTDDLAELKEHTTSKVGLRWRLKVLNQALGSLRKGDFGFIFARPESGKTTFLASEVTFMAGGLVRSIRESRSGVSTIFQPGHQYALGPIVWFNNEEQGTKVQLRCYQAALGCTLAQLFSDVEGCKAKYSELTGNLIRIVDRASITKQEVETICKAIQPSLIIFDQIDKIKGFEADRTDLTLGQIYQWARELAKTYAPVVAVCQADGSGEGQRWLTMANVSNAKTSKQAEADWILGIGKTNDSGMEYVRYLHLSKNKLTGDEDSIPEMRHCREEVIIQPEIARYKDPME